MIDFIHLKTQNLIPAEALKPEYWAERPLKDGTVYWVHKFREACVLYYPLTGKWSIKGKILTWLHDTQVANVDDLYGTDLQGFVNEINAYLQGLVEAPMVDILEWETYRIDYCFNIKTPYVSEYLDVMNEGFRMSNTGSRVNYPEEKGLSGSSYIKTKGDYKVNELRNYVLNFYDKYDRLEYLRRRGMRIAEDDWKLARNVLRVEVQCGYVFIKELCEKLNISRAFGDLLSYDVAYMAEEWIYRRVFKAEAEQDYYAYQMAKKLLGKQRKALEVLESSAEHHRITDGKYAYGRKQIQKAGIYPYAFLKKGSGVEVLPNPLKLIQEKLAAIGAVEDCA